MVRCTEQWLSCHPCRAQARENTGQLRSDRRNCVYEAQRALQALRLFKDGDIAMGQMSILHQVYFSLDWVGGAVGFPASSSLVGDNPYMLDEPELHRYASCTTRYCGTRA